MSTSVRLHRRVDLGRHETFLVHVQEAIAIPGHEGDVQHINALLQPDEEEGKRLLLEEDQGGPQRDLVQHTGAGTKEAAT